ncbi:MAG TPA: VWA domain-containing protein [Spirochaetota bacterium]|nr:VWA domain-containing protein [Spirochaetota bacterium]HOD15318.1 VWA domain-containing protein [Spirochaetota bacterium]HPG51642.1 VWA domain-containing protein [Spirochaetota bacterium]HPN13788.1 VWA domain-containing protein [Spirochaetota bacterium]HQL81487.1 VWA domain-containing protein [Spirochaetota bacterium]
MAYLEFKDPLLLLLLVPWAAMLAWYLFRQLYNREAAVAISSERIVRVRGSIRAATYRFLPALRFAALLLLIVALSRPGKGVDYSSIKNLGVDIMIAMDVSQSMRAEDFQPKNRLAVSKQVIGDFVERRTNDRLGMVIFAGEAYLQCPLTLEHGMISDLAGEVDFDSVHVDGTAIGDAIALSTARMMDSKAKSRLILLVTDGRNNRGAIDPETAAKAAAEMGIKVYTVGIGKIGEPVPYPTGIPMIKQQVMLDMDEETLQKVAEITGGRYYNATSSGVLWQNIKDIDRLEKSQVEIKQYHEFYDRFQWLIVAAVSLFFLEVLLRSVVYRKVP